MLSRMRRAHPPQTSALRGGRCAQPRMQHQQEAGRAGATRAWRSARGQRGAGGRRARSSASTSLCTAWKRSHAPSSAAMCCSQPARSHPFTAAAGAAPVERRSAPRRPWRVSCDLVQDSCGLPSAPAAGRPHRAPSRAAPARARPPAGPAARAARPAPPRPAACLRARRRAAWAGPGHRGAGHHASMAAPHKRPCCGQVSVVTTQAYAAARLSQTHTSAPAGFGRTLSVKHAQDVLHVCVQLRAQRAVALCGRRQVVHAPQGVCAPRRALRASA